MGRLGRYVIALVPLCFLLVIAPSLAQTCGKRRVVNLLVVNGIKSKDGHWPWHVALFHNEGLSFEYACGGTILDQATVLTAAHCVMTQNGEWERERLLVHVGRNRLRVDSNRVQKHEVLQLIVHPNYTVSSSKHDIALIKLATDITYTDYIQPICLWNRGEDLNTIVGTKGTVIGFGRDETGNVSDTLREAKIPVVSHMTCIQSNRNTFAFHLTTNMFCAGSRDGISPCNGDSGGGLFFKYNDVWFIRGVVSFTKLRRNTFLCDTNEYTVFTDVAKYLQWIVQYMRGTEGQPEVTKTAIRQKIRLLPMSTCGANPYADREESSKPVLLGYPWVGLLEYTEFESLKTIAVCHATLISDLYLITTAYCGDFFNFVGLGHSVRLGEYDRNTTNDCAEVDGQMVCSPKVQRLRVEKVILHKGYNASRFSNDIALIRLRDRADTSQSNVQPICLPVTSKLRSQKSTYYIQTAWDKYVHDNLLKRSLRKIMESVECQELIKIWWGDIYEATCPICMKEQFNVEHQYPLKGAQLQLVQQLRRKSRYVLYGVLSFMPKSQNKFDPYVFTNVSSYMDWILENIQE